ncbi:MAG: hypothetical protein IPN76_28685 [Saprospiraceae bacterium]|nr:hypothetical protein [Saprospiraceae bacterium]
MFISKFIIILCDKANNFHQLLGLLNEAVIFAHQIYPKSIPMARHLDLTSIPIPSSSSYERGKFGRLFPTLPRCLEDTEQAKSDMDDVARTMFKIGGSDSESDMPAGYTYLGQFIIHDISFDPTSINERQVDPEFLWNFRTPALDLDSVYGGGPSVAPYFYDPDKNFGITHFLLPAQKMSIDKKEPTKQKDYSFFDLPRTCTKMQTAIIPDPRNDENIIISQIHAAFLQFHNSEADRLGREEEDRYKNRPEDLFRAVQETVKWHYQWIVLYDYLPRILDLSEWGALMKLVKIKKDKTNKLFMKQIEEIAKGNIDRKFYNWRNEPFIPLEFSVAAFRFGHSQVRFDYQFNKDPSSNNMAAALFPVRPASLFPDKPIESKKPFARVAMPFFFPKPGNNNFNKNKLIEPILSGNLMALPFNLPPLADNNTVRNRSLDNTVKINERNLAERNLKRSLMLRLPSGQSVANAMSYDPLEIEPKLLKEWTKNEQNDFPPHLVKNTPLWYYILYEARKLQEGKRLGPVGSRIVAEVIIGLIQGDKTSFLNQDPNWRPMKKNKEGIITKIDIDKGESFNMADLLEMAGVYNP